MRRGFNSKNCLSKSKRRKEKKEEKESFRKKYLELKAKPPPPPEYTGGASFSVKKVLAEIIKIGKEMEQ